MNKEPSRSSRSPDSCPSLSESITRSKTKARDMEFSTLLSARTHILEPTCSKPYKRPGGSAAQALTVNRSISSPTYTGTCPSGHLSCRLLAGGPTSSRRIPGERWSWKGWIGNSSVEGYIEKSPQTLERRRISRFIL
ncbi:hypothetical protein OIU79_000614 [Salix purpurea]|uniref:Uncharacterized protein n=1 Tax=Salix purpurea TaxID=77065 RepID=A0A9Q0V3I1_SALPP|nr:hypothetical protein OIU79_000614 [Salix purpurea]